MNDHIAKPAEPIRPWCDEHWRPYTQPKANGTVASALLQQALLESDQFKRLCGWNPELGTKADASAANLNRHVRSILPICCYLGEATLQSILDRSTIKYDPNEWEVPNLKVEPRNSDLPPDKPY